MTNISQHPTPRFYEHSGTVPAVAVAGGIGAALAVAIFGGAVLAILEVVLHHLPLNKLRLILIFIAMFVAGVALGLIPTKVLMRLKARSNAAATFLGFMAGLMGLYAAWIVWIKLVTGLMQIDVPVSNMLGPAGLVREIQSMNQANAWRVFNDDTGNLVPLQFFWVLEALIVVCVATFSARLKMASEVFCDRCGTWGVKRELMKIQDSDATALRAALAQGNIEPLLQPRSPPKDAMAWYEITLRGCPTCDNLQLLQVTRTVKTLDKDGKESKTEDTLINKLLLAPGQSGALILAAADIQPVAPDQAESLPPK